MKPLIIGTLIEHMHNVEVYIYKTPNIDFTLGVYEPVSFLRAVLLTKLKSVRIHMLRVFVI